MSEPEKEEFTCPLCGSHDYSEKIKSNRLIGPAGRSWIAYYICGGCSVIFSNLKKFSKIKKQVN